MLDLSGINLWAVLVAFIINVALGSFWYSPAGFGKKWSKLSGHDILKMPKNEANRAIMFVILASLVQTVVLAVILNSLHVAEGTHPLTNGFIAGVVLWLGLTAATTVGNTLYMRQSWRFWWINSSFFFIVMAINSVILAGWK
jgi:hypothetical protein